jgi:phosphatidylglycerophosphate synthase
LPTVFDAWLRPYKDDFLRPVARLMSAPSPHAITAAALLSGLAAAGMAGMAWYRTALGLWLLNRLLDGLDGLAAREHGRVTDFGGYLDIMADFGVYAAVPIGLYLSQPGTGSALSLIVMLGSFYVNAASWMYLSAILEKRGAGAGVRGEVTSVTMPPGPIGGTETILFYAAFLIWPDQMSGLFMLMAGLVLVGVGQRLWWAQGNLSRPPDH